MSFRLGQEVEIFIERLGIYGEGVGYVEGFTLFVEGALPGERVKVAITERRRTFARGQVIAFLERSLHRVDPICPLFHRCGGCQLMHLDYAEQLVNKRQRVVDALERIGKLSGIDIHPCVPSPQPLAYRNKIQLPMAPSGRLGLYARHTHQIVEIDHCLIHCPLGEEVFERTQALLSAQGLDHRTIKHVLIKTGTHTGEVLVVLVTHASDLLTPFAQKLMEAMPAIRGVVQNINPSEGNVVLSSDFHLLAGQGWIEEKILGLYFKISPASFFQVNPAQAEQLYKQVLSFSELTGKEKVLDAYCGVGTLSLILAQHAAQVIGVESVPEAIADAQHNSVRNQIANTQFHCSRVEKFISTLDHIDVAILNPPRRGCEHSVLEKIAQIKPKRLVYVSCDPATLARDLRFLKDKGYTIDQAIPFDMFPQTAHVETVVRATFSMSI